MGFLSRSNTTASKRSLGRSNSKAGKRPFSEILHIKRADSGKGSSLAPINEPIRLPDGTPVENVKAHIQSLEVQMNQDQIEIEDAKDATTALRRNIENVEARIPEAEQTREHAGHKKQQGEHDFEQAVKVLNEKKLRADREFEDAIKAMNAKKMSAERDFETAIRSMNEKKGAAEKDFEEAVKALDDLQKNKESFQNQIVINDTTEREKVAAIEANRELIELLKSLSKAGEFAALTREGKYRCDFCGRVEELERQEKHNKKCWGRCKRCHKKGLECDAGNLKKKEFSTCSCCQKSGSQCTKMGMKRKEARGNSVLPEEVVKAQ